MMLSAAPAPLWTPAAARVEAAAMTRFMRAADRPDYAALHEWSLREPDAFWRLVWEFCAIRGEPGDVAFAPHPPRHDAPHDAPMGGRFFPDGRLNFAANLMRRRDSGAAIRWRGESGDEQTLSWRDLHRRVSRVQARLREIGVSPGDRVAALMPNIPETVIAMLAATGLGAVWSSCSPDFGPRGVLDRFGQIAPAVLIACDGYVYQGTTRRIADTVRQVSAALPDATLLTVPVIDDPAVHALPGARLLEETGAPEEGEEGEFPLLPFSHPLCIVFSSGTTGQPKCLVHSAGGVLIQHLKEHVLHGDLGAGDRIFFFTTCGWMMWNWLVSGLAAEAEILLYDGAPLHPDPGVLFDYAEDARATHFGVSAKFFDAVRQSGLRPGDTRSFKELKTIFSTGSPLSGENFDFIHDAVKPDVHLASISGGTDILSCFVLGNPCLPVWRGEIQCPGLGMATEVWDDTGAPTANKGELVCTKPFPSMPLGLWNDPSGARYQAAYFERFPGVWHHGDYAQTTRHGGMVIHGRSDATLNPGGVRIGTAEIYAPLDSLPQVADALAIGQALDGLGGDLGGDVRIVLFIVPAAGVEVDESLRAEIRQRIRSGASPRHVPAVIAAVSDLPRTRSGKISELAVRAVVHGREITNREALANPEALDQFRDRPELRT